MGELEGKMREAETESHEGKRKAEALWPIFKIHHQKARYIFDLFYRRKAISRELSEVYPDQGHQLRHQLHLQGAQEQAGGGPDSGVRALWLQGVFWLGWGGCCTSKNKL